MANQAPESNNFNWPPNRLSVIRRRAWVLAGFCLLTFFSTVFVKVLTVETVRLEQQGLVKRQFQLGGLLGGMFREAIGATPLEIPSIAEPVKQDPVTTSWISSHTVETSTVASHTPESSRTVTETSGSSSSHGDPNKLLEILAAAVKQAIRESEQFPSTIPKHLQKSVLSDLIAGHSKAASLSADSSTSLSFQISRPSTVGNLPTPSVRILGGLSADGITLRVHTARAIAEELPSQSSTDGPSFLSEVSKIVAEISGIDPIAAAKLTDTVLDALHVNPSAIASAVPKVANQASLSAADLLPLVIPAVAKAMDQPLPPVPSVSTLDMVETLNKVLQQGTTVINDLSRALEDITDPSLLAVVNQLAIIVSAVASYLNKPLCVVDQVVDGNSFEAVIPCDSAEVESLTSAGQLTTLAAPVLPESTHYLSTSGEITTIASPIPYSSSNLAPPSKSAVESPTKTDSQSSANGGNGDGPASGNGAPTETTSASPSCPTCPSCDQCAPKICSVQGPEGPSAHQPPDPLKGPCPGKGFKCAECLDGWFCPPQETPAQVAPCGVGWPCYHCSEGWFCASKETPNPTPPPSPSSKETGNTGTSGATTPSMIPNTGDLPDDWSHLGCFQDAISRILLGAKPVDYLQGDMSTKECVDHCISGGYKFAGTENGRECWCGTSIRDDALRLPESQCGKPCQGQPTEACGGSWAMDVFLCSNESESHREPPGKSNGGFMFRLLSNFKSNNREAHRQSF
ncbi:WSC domain-containing protein [Trichoderma velutinum]